MDEHPSARRQNVPSPLRTFQLQSPLTPPHLHQRTKSSTILLTTRIFLPIVFTLLFTITSVIVLIYTLDQHSPLPPKLITILAILFGTLFSIWILCGLLLCVRKRWGSATNAKADLECASSSSGTEHGGGYVNVTKRAWRRSVRGLGGEDGVRRSFGAGLDDRLGVWDRVRFLWRRVGQGGCCGEQRCGHTRDVWYSRNRIDISPGESLGSHAAAVAVGKGKGSADGNFESPTTHIRRRDADELLRKSAELDSCEVQIDGFDIPRQQRNMRQHPSHYPAHRFDDSPESHDRLLINHGEPLQGVDASGPAVPPKVLIAGQTVVRSDVVQEEHAFRYQREAFGSSNYQCAPVSSIGIDDADLYGYQWLEEADGRITTESLDHQDFTRPNPSKRQKLFKVGIQNEGIIVPPSSSVEAEEVRSDISTHSPENPPQKAKSHEIAFTSASPPIPTKSVKRGNRFEKSLRGGRKRWDVAAPAQAKVRSSQRTLVAGKCIRLPAEESSDTGSLQYMTTSFANTSIQPQSRNESLLNFHAQQQRLQSREQAHRVATVQIYTPQPRTKQTEPPTPPSSSQSQHSTSSSSQEHSHQNHLSSPVLPIPSQPKQFQAHQHQRTDTWRNSTERLTQPGSRGLMGPPLPPTTPRHTIPNNHHPSPQNENETKRVGIVPVSKRHVITINHTRNHGSEISERSESTDTSSRERRTAERETRDGVRSCVGVIDEYEDGTEAVNGDGGTLREENEIRTSEHERSEVARSPLVPEPNTESRGINQQKLNLSPKFFDTAEAQQQDLTGEDEEGEEEEEHDRPIHTAPTTEEAYTSSAQGEMRYVPHILTTSVLDPAHKSSNPIPTSSSPHLHSERPQNDLTESNIEKSTAATAENITTDTDTNTPESPIIEILPFLNNRNESDDENSIYLLNQGEEDYTYLNAFIVHRQSGLWIRPRDHDEKMIELGWI